MNSPTDKEIRDFLEFLLEQKSRKQLNSYISIKNAISQYSIPFPSINIPKGKILYRARRHNENCNFFEDIDNISYRKDIYNINEFGRSNEPCQSIFYSCDNEHVSFFETTHFHKKNENIESEIMTVGIWEVQEEIRVAHIPSNDSIKGLNKTVDGLQETLENLINKFLYKNSDLYKKVINLFSTEYTREADDDDTNYLISCAFSNYIYDHYGYDTYLKKPVQVEGILYPSVTLRTEGMNIAIKPDVINNGKLKLVNAVRRKLEKVENFTIKDKEILIAKKINYKTGKIEW